MKKALLTLLIAAIAGFTYAQSVDIGVKGGLSIPNLSASGSETTPLNEGYSSRTGPGFAVFADIKFSKLFSIQPSVEFSAQGGKKDGLQAFPPADFIARAEGLIPAELIPVITPQLPQYLYADFNSTAKMNYLLVPVLAKFGWDFSDQSPFRFYAGAGPFVGFLMNAKQITSGSSRIYFDENGQVPLAISIPNPEDPNSPTIIQPSEVDLTAETDIKDQLNKVNFGFQANVGVSYKINRSSLFVEGGGNYGLINIQKGTANGKNNTGAATVMIGYAYSL